MKKLLFSLCQNRLFMILFQGSRKTGIFAGVGKIKKNIKNILTKTPVFDILYTVEKDFD